MKTKDIGILFIRLVLAFIFLLNGIPKILQPSNAIEKFTSYGISGFMAPVIGAISIIAAILILTGIGFKLGNLIMITISIVGILAVHTQNNLSIGLERNLLIIATTIFLFINGPGTFVINNKMINKSRLQQ